MADAVAVANCHLKNSPAISWVSGVKALTTKAGCPALFTSLKMSVFFGSSSAGSKTMN